MGGNWVVFFFLKKHAPIAKNILDPKQLWGTETVLFHDACQTQSQKWKKIMNLEPGHNKTSLCFYI